MSLMGQERRFRRFARMSAVTPTATNTVIHQNRRNVPEAIIQLERMVYSPTAALARRRSVNRIARRLLVEPFVGERNTLPVDYKFWVFHGRVEFIQVDVGREHNHTRAMFTREWRRAPFNTTFPLENRRFEQPVSFQQMIEAAELLREDMQFVRVDLYEVDKKPRFGEFTFYPASGTEIFDPPEYDRIVGQLWR
jgi:TupA-like ATPgrasp